MEIKHESYFIENKKSAEVLAAFKIAYDKYVLDTNKKFGRDKNLEKYVNGYELAYYHHGDLLWEPIIFNLDKGKKIVDYDKMGLNDDVSLKAYLNNKHNPYKVLETFALFFHDGNQTHEFIFNSASHYPKKIMYDAQAVSEISATLNEVFFIKPLSDQLELDLGEKSYKIHKPKI